MAVGTYAALQSANQIQGVTSLKIQAFDKILAMRSLADTIFFKLGENYIDKMTPIPASWILKIPPEAGQAHQVNFPLLMPLRGQETKGNTSDQIYNIEDPTFKSFTAYYNDVSHAVKLDQYGIAYLDSAPYGVKEKVADLLATFWKELMDYYMQFMILNKYSPNLLESPINLSIVPHKNTFVKGVYYANQPYNNYNANANYFNSVVASTMDLADANHANNFEKAFDVPFALAMAEWVNVTGVLKPFNFGGRNSYVWALPSSQITQTINPLTIDGFGAVWEATTKLNTEEMSLPGVIGRARNILFVENYRAPTAKTFGTGSGPGTMVGTVGDTNSVMETRYLKPGLNDQRHTTGNIWEPGFILGQAGCAEVNSGVHIEYEVQDFKRFKATGMFNTVGFNRVDYGVDNADATTNTATSTDNFSSAVTWFRKQTGYFNDNTVNG
jgi:hypothetical protein